MLPRVVAGPGASGSFSMLENRNCIGHDVNDDTLDGDNDVGTGNTGVASSVIQRIVERGCHSVVRTPDPAGVPARHHRAASRMSSAMAEGSMNGVK
jgi:hypothetical protein